MKVCFWVSHVATVGGVQRVTSLIANALSEYYDVTIVTNDNMDDLKKNIYGISEDVTILIQPDKLNRIMSLPVYCKVLKRVNKLSGILNKFFPEIGEKVYFPQAKRNLLVQYFNDFDFDVIIAVQGYNAILLSMIADRINAKTIGWQHNSFQAYFRTPNEYFWNQDFLFKKYLKCLDAYIALNQDDAEKIGETFGIYPLYIYNPKSFSSVYTNDASSHYFVAAGRFCKAKGFDVLIDAVKCFTRNGSDWKIFLVGDGEEKQEIMAKIKEYNLEEYFILPGFTDDIQKYLRKASVLLLPSRWEGMPMIVLEALEMGLPVISFDIPAIKPLITNMQEGIIVDHKTGAVGFSEAMKMISSNLDLRKKMANNAKKKAKAFDMEEIFPHWLNLITEVCDSEEEI